MEAIACSNLSQRFRARWVLSRLTFSLPVGARLLLTGENGAGKTTLLRLLATALRPSRGEVRLFGQAVWPDGRGVRRRLGLMTHQHYLYEALNAHENLHLVRRLAGLGADRKIASALDEAGLHADHDAPVATYSAGMKRRLALARLLLLQPELIFFDEPFAQLDPDGQALVSRIIGRMGEEGKTLVIASHDVERTKPLCTHHVHLSAQGVSAQVRLLPKDAA